MVPALAFETSCGFEFTLFYLAFLVADVKSIGYGSVGDFSIGEGDVEVGGSLVRVVVGYSFCPFC